VTSREPVVAAYSSAPGSALDFPYVVLDDDPGTTRAAADLLAALRDDTGRALLAARGFRDAAGRAGTALRGVAGVDARAEVVNRPPTREDLDVARDMLGTLGRGTRMLAVVDVSGSMATTVPGTPGLTRLELAQRAAATGLSLLPETASVGLWVFSTDLGPGRDHRVVVPVADGLQQRDALTSGLAGLRPVPGGATGLYDTTLAAVRHVRATYDPDRTNAVVLLTDGANEDPSGIGLATLLHRLRAESHPRRPVPVIAVAYGPDIDAAALRAVSEVTGGATYVAVDPRDVQRVLLDAIGQRLCRPDCGLLR
jgi:Mg-chelatase subunit ChlD